MYFTVNKVAEVEEKPRINGGRQKGRNTPPLIMRAGYILRQDLNVQKQVILTGIDSRHCATPIVKMAKPTDYIIVGGSMLNQRSKWPKRVIIHQ